MNISEIAWKESLDLGYSLIDTHHKKLISLINELAKILAGDQETYKNNIGKVLKGIVDYTIYHFNAEEQVMARYKYPELEAHKKSHSDFIAVLKENHLGLLQGEMEKGIVFYTHLCDWLLEHIARTDKKWALYIAEKYPNAKIE